MKFGKHVLRAFLLAAFSTRATAFSEYSTSVDVYLDPASSGGADINDTRWEISSAVSQLGGSEDCDFLRDFIFTCGWYNDNAASEWTCSASNNSVGNPRSNDPFTLPQQAGWYTFRHVFKDVAGALSVDFEILDADGNVLNTWTRSQSNPADLSTLVAGNRYGWFVRIGCTEVNGGLCTANDSTFRLPIDNTQKCFGDLGCDFFQGFEVDTTDWLDFGNPPSSIARVSSGENGIDSASGNFYAELVPGGGGIGSFTRWNGYCTEGPFPCRPRCNVPLEVTGLCDLEVLLECDDGNKASNNKGKGKKTKSGGKGKKAKSGGEGSDQSSFDPSLIAAAVRCDCAQGTPPLTDEEENFCLSLQVGSCMANLDVIGSAGSVMCVVDDVAFTLTANTPDSKSKSKSKGSKSRRILRKRSKGRGKGSSPTIAAEICEF